LRGNRDFHTTLQCGLPGLVSPQHSSFVIVLELPAFLLCHRTSFLAQVVTLTGPREPGRNCQTPRPPPLDLPSLRESASPGVALTPVPSFTHTRNHFVSIHSSASVCIPFFRCPRLPHTSKVKIQIEFQKSKKAKARSAKSLKESLEPR